MAGLGSRGALFPYALTLAPDDPVPDLPSLDDAGREGLAALLVGVLERLDRLFGEPIPYMLWIHQRPFDGGAWPQARLHVEIVSPWRAAGVPRYVAAGELGSGVFYTPVPPSTRRRRCAMRSEAHARRSASVDALAALLFPGGSPSWERPELTSLGTLPPARRCLRSPPELAATLDRTRSRWLRSLDGKWEFRLVDRPDLAPAAAPRAGVGGQLRCRASGRCSATSLRTTRTS